VQYSTDNGITWLNLSASAPGSTSGGGNLAISADGTKVVYEPGGTTTVRFATRTGSTWSAFAAPTSGSPANNARIVADLSAAQTFYAYVGTTVSRSTDGGANWSVMTTTAPSNANWIRAVPGVSGHLFMSRTGSGLWRSTDGGATWTQVSPGVVTTALGVGVGAAAPGASYPAIYVAGTVGNTTGFFRSDDQGATWTTITDADHQYGYITVVQADPRVYGRVYVGANGRSVLYGGIAPSLPAGWVNTAIGSPAQQGVANVTGNVWTLEGAGSGIGGTSDQFQFANAGYVGDTTITAKVRGVQNTSAAATGGVMIRNGTAPDAAFVAVMQQPDGEVQLIWRSTPGASAQSSGLVGGASTSRWLRLARVGNSFQGYYSDNGTSWIAIASPVTVSMSSAVRAGLAVTSTSPADLCAAAFSDVNVTRGTHASKIQPMLDAFAPNGGGVTFAIDDMRFDGSTKAVLEGI